MINDEELEAAISEEEREAAMERGLEMRRTIPLPVSVRYDPAARLIEVKLNWGYSIQFPPERAQGLEGATDEQLSRVEIAGVWGIHFPALDADLWVPGLIEGRFGTAKWEAAWRENHPEVPRQNVNQEKPQQSEAA
jgi:hypothetical protein